MPNLNFVKFLKIHFQKYLISNVDDFSFISLDTTFIRELNSDKIYGAYEKPFETYQKAYNFYIKLAKNYQTETYYLNIGLNDLPVFQWVMNDFLQNEMIDLGLNAFPIAEDINQDGLKDLLH